MFRFLTYFTVLFVVSAASAEELTSDDFTSAARFFQTVIPVSNKVCDTNSYEGDWYFIDKTGKKYGHRLYRKLVINAGWGDFPSAYLGYRDSQWFFLADSGREKLITVPDGYQLYRVMDSTHIIVLDSSEQGYGYQVYRTDTKKFLTPKFDNTSYCGGLLAAHSPYTMGDKNASDFHDRFIDGKFAYLFDCRTDKIQTYNRIQDGKKTSLWMAGKNIVCSETCDLRKGRSTYKGKLLDEKMRDIIVLPDGWEIETGFREGQCLASEFTVNESGKYTTPLSKRFISLDEKGNTVFSTKQQELRSKSDGFLRFRKSFCEYGFLDANGKEVLPPIYREATDFKGGTAFVQIETENCLTAQTYEIDKKGRKICRFFNNIDKLSLDLMHLGFGFSNGTWHHKPKDFEIYDLSGNKIWSTNDKNVADTLKSFYVRIGNSLNWQTLQVPKPKPGQTYREWKTTDGLFFVWARIVTVRGSEVQLELRNGKRTTMDFEDLRKEDQEYIRRQIELDQEKLKD